MKKQKNKKIIIIHSLELSKVLSQIESGQDFVISKVIQSNYNLEGRRLYP